MAEHEQAAAEQLRDFERLETGIEEPEYGGDGDAPESQEYETKGLLQMVIGPVFQILAPAWGVQPEEVSALADAYAPIVDEWFPEGVGGPYVGAALVTLAVIGPRLGKPRRLEPPKPKPKGGQETGDREQSEESGEPKGPPTPENLRAFVYEDAR